MKEELINNMTEECIEKKGIVTCGFRIHKDVLAKTIEALGEASKKLETHGGYWIVRWCETCKGYEEDAPFHAEILRTYIQV